MARILETIIFDLFLLHIRKLGHTEGKGLSLVTQQGRGRDKKGIQFPDLELPHHFSCASLFAVEQGGCVY